MNNTLIIIIASAVYYLLSSFIESKIFRKANVKQIKAYIPFYRIFKLLNILDLKWYYIFGLILSPANICFWIYMQMMAEI